MTETLSAVVNAALSNPCWVEFGQAIGPALPSTTPGAAAGAWEVLVKLLPSERTLYATVLNLGQGNGKGAFVPIQDGDRLLVLFPGGNPNRAVALGGFGVTTKAPNPLGNLGTSILVQHPGGVRLVGADGQPEHGIVHGGFLDALSSYLTALEGFMFTISTATTAPQIATAALDFMAEVQQVGVAPSTFAAAVSASAASGTAPGVGGPPYATALHKVTP